MKKKKRKEIWILLLVLAVLLGIFFLMRYLNQRSEEEEAKAEEDAVIHIYETDSLEGMSYTDGTDTVSFIKEDGIWRYEPDTTIDLTESTMSTLEETFSDITAVQEITEPDDLADYGFDSPSYELTLTSDGESRTFQIGSASGENYYFMEKDGDTVYTVASALTSEMLWDMADFAERDSFVTVTTDNFVREVITAPDGTETVFDSENEDQEDAVTSVANGLAAFYFTDCADYHVTDETLSQYGLDENSRTTVVLTYTEDNDDGEEEEKSVTFYIGSQDEDGTYYYVQMDGSQRVSRATIDNVEMILGQNIEEEE